MLSCWPLTHQFHLKAFCCQSATGTSHGRDRADTVTPVPWRDQILPGAQPWAAGPWPSASALLLWLGEALSTSLDPTPVLKSSVGPPRMKGLRLPFYSCCYYRHINRSPPTPLSLCFTASHRDCDLSWPLVQQLHGSFQRGSEKKRREFSKTPERIFFFFFLCEFKVVNSCHTTEAAIVKQVAYPSKPLPSLLSKLSGFLIMFWLVFRTRFYSRRGGRVRSGRGKGK